MLSPHTPPGTKIECVEASNEVWRRAKELRLGVRITEAVLGQRYTLRAITPNFGVFGVLVDEIVNPLHPLFNLEFTFRLERFRRVTDISDLQRLLVSAPIKEPVTI